MRDDIRFWIEAIGLYAFIGFMLFVLIYWNDGNWCGWICSDDVKRRW